MPLGHHWVPWQVTSNKLTKLTDGAVSVAIAYTSGRLDHRHGGANNVYNGIDRATYNELVDEEFDKFYKVKNKRLLSGDDMFEFAELIRQGKGADGKIMKRICQFNKGVTQHRQNYIDANPTMRGDRVERDVDYLRKRGRGPKSHPRFARYLQGFLQAKAPLWRVVVRGIDDQTTIVVYPTAVVLPATTDRDTQLSTIREKMLHHRDRTVGVFNRQMEYAKQVLASWAPVSKPPYMPRVVWPLGSDKGDTQCLAIWILEDGYGHEKRSWIPDDETTDGFQGIAGMTGLDVTEDGHVAAYMTAGDKFVGVLTGLIYSKRAFRGSIELREPSTGKRQKFEIAEETVLSDEEVQRRLGFKSR